jgi:uncharacterized membrane protein
VLVTLIDPKSPHPPRRKVTFSEDFKRFFLRGLAALLPTLITLSVVWYILNFLWESIGWYLIRLIKEVWLWLVQVGWVSPTSAGHIGRVWGEDQVQTRVVGVILAIVLVYFVGLLVGNLIGRTFWRAGESLVMKIPLIRAIYPAVKQVTDFVLADRKARFEASRVVAVQPHEKGIWSIGLVTGTGLKSLDEKIGDEMVMVFLPNSPAAFSGYVLVVPRSQVVDLPLTVEEAMRLFVSGGVILPGTTDEIPATLREAVKLGLNERKHESGVRPVSDVSPASLPADAPRNEASARRAPGVS